MISFEILLICYVFTFRFFRVLYLKVQTCQPLVKENLETHEQKSGDSAKNSEIQLIFPDQTPFPSRELGTSLIPMAYSPLKMADRRGEKR